LIYFTSIFITYAARRRREKKRRTWVVLGFLNTSSRVSAKNPSQDVDTAKAHVSVGDVSRQPFFLAILLEFAVREDIEKAGCSTGCKITIISAQRKMIM
jgi:hypothetical protein